MSETLFQRLRADHSRVLDRAAALELAVAETQAGGRIDPTTESALRELLGLLKGQFATHMRLEEEALYPALRSVLPATSASLSPLSSEHSELVAMLAALIELAARPGDGARDEQITVQVRDLADLLRIHIRKEEAVVFSIAERVLGPAELARLGRFGTGADHSDPSPRPAPGDSKGIHL